MEISSNFEPKTKFDFPALLCQCGVAEVVVNPRWPPRTSVGKQERATSLSASCSRRWGWSGFLCCLFRISGVGDVDFGFLGVSRCKWGVRQRVGWAWSPSVPPPPHTHSDDQLLRNSSSPKESIFIIDINDMTVVNIDSYPRMRGMFQVQYGKFNFKWALDQNLSELIIINMNAVLVWSEVQT